jgi:hypothetical protein
MSLAAGYAGKPQFNEIRRTSSLAVTSGAIGVADAEYPARNEFPATFAMLKRTRP